MLTVIATLFAGAAMAQSVWVTVDLSDQQMTLRRDGAVEYVWPVSTARAGKVTPIGTFTPYLMRRTHYSSLYNNAPMPWSIFFRGNYAIHGTTAVDRLGAPASAGCIRLAPENAQTLYLIVQEAGMQNARVVVVQ